MQSTRLSKIVFDKDEENGLLTAKTAVQSQHEKEAEYTSGVATPMFSEQITKRKTLIESQNFNSDMVTMSIDNNYINAIKDLLFSIKQYFIPIHNRIKFSAKTIQKWKINEDPRKYYDFYRSFRMVQSQGKYSDADHVNIAQVEAIFETDLNKFDHKDIISYEEELQRDHLYIVSEFYDGDSLFNYIIKKGYLEEQDVRIMAKYLLSVIRYCHQELKVVIGCLNPEDIAIDSQISKTHVRLLNLNESWPINQTHFKDFEIENKIKSYMSLKGTFPNKFLFLAPEILTYSYYIHRDFKVEISPKVDIWALGCLIYNMITGVPPYYSDRLDDLQQQLMYSDIRLYLRDNEMISECSSDLLDFLHSGYFLIYLKLKSALEVKSDKRMSVDQAFEHPWIKNTPPFKNTLQKSIFKDAFKRMKDFKHDCEFLKLVSHLIGNYIISKDKKSIVYKIFQAFDIQSRGYITKVDMTQVLTENEVKFSKEDIGIIFENLDSNKDGRIYFFDVCPSLIDKKDLFNKHYLKEAMSLMDHDKDKLIGFDDLRLMLDTQTVDDAMILSMIRQIEGNPSEDEQGQKEGITFRNFLILCQTQTDDKFKNNR